MSSTWAAWPLLIAAIGIEVMATAALPRTHSFREPAWTVAVVGGYALSIWMLTLVVSHIPVSVAYAVWSGLGTAGIAGVSYLFLGEALNPVKVAAIGLIVGGVVLLNLQTTAH